MRRNGRTTDDPEAAVGSFSIHHEGLLYTFFNGIVGDSTRMREIGAIAKCCRRPANPGRAGALCRLSRCRIAERESHLRWQTDTPIRDAQGSAFAGLASTLAPLSPERRCATSRPTTMGKVVNAQLDETVKLNCLHRCLAATPSASRFSCTHCELSIHRR